MCMSDFFRELKNKLMVKTDPQLDERILHLVQSRARHQKKSTQRFWWGLSGLAAASLVVVMLYQQKGSGEGVWQESPEMLTHMQEVEFFLETENLLEEDWAELEVTT